MEYSTSKFQPKSWSWRKTRYDVLTEMCNMRIPDIQRRLRDIAAHEKRVPKALRGELLELAAALSRRKPMRIGVGSSVKMTPEIRERIRAIAARNPDFSQAKIAQRVKVNPGRVSEVLSGLRV
jgi:hypothetical protein